MAKLYPPTISGTLPACQKDDNGTVTFTVPFSMNRAIQLSAIGGFSLKVKTAQSNTLLVTLETTYNSSESETIDYLTRTKTLTFTFNDTNSSIKIGQYLKLQLAYVGKQGTADEGIGYYSTVGVSKCTGYPKAEILDSTTNQNEYGVFQSTYVGIYTPPENDPTERPYSYNFSLYYDGNLIETSGWLLHNTSANSIYSDSMSLTEAIDTYDFKSAFFTSRDGNSGTYEVEYRVRTINNIEVPSTRKSYSIPGASSATISSNFVASNEFDDGYIKLALSYTNSNNQGANSINIYRTDDTSQFTAWNLLSRHYLGSNSVNAEFRDFTVEQGVTYQYAFASYNTNSAVSQLNGFSNEITADFEDMFLWDGERQLKIRFNPKVSSFKVNHLESKMETIGSRYPFIFRNTVVEYREFPIAGLISYLEDENEFFVNHKEDLGVIGARNVPRFHGTPTDLEQDDINIGKSWEWAETTDPIGRNIKAERRFKQIALNWLGDGKVKLFRSPTEGNYLVRLMNVSLSPEDKLGRMIHNFSCTACEIKDFSFANLVELNLLNTNKDINSSYAISGSSNYEYHQTATPNATTTTQSTYPQNNNYTQQYPTQSSQLNTPNTTYTSPNQASNQYTIPTYNPANSSAVYTPAAADNTSGDSSSSGNIYNPDTTYQPSSSSNTPVDTNAPTDIKTRTIMISDMVNLTSDLNAGENPLTKVRQINRVPIYEFLQVSMASGRSSTSGETGFYLRIGSSNNSLVLISPSNGLTINSENNLLQDVFFCPADNLGFIEYDNNNPDYVDIEKQLIDLVGDSQLTYRYYMPEPDIADYNYVEAQEYEEEVNPTPKNRDVPIQDVVREYYINVIRTLNGPLEDDAFSFYWGNNESHEVQEFFVLNFYKKPVRDIYRISYQQYQDDQGNQFSESNLDELSFYRIHNGNNEYYGYVSNGQLITNNVNGYDTNIKLITTDGNIVEFSEPPLAIDIAGKIYTSIKMGNGVYLEYACKEKVVVYRQKE